MIEISGLGLLVVVWLLILKCGLFFKCCVWGMCLGVVDVSLSYGYISNGKMFLYKMCKKH